MRLVVLTLLAIAFAWSSAAAQAIRSPNVLYIVVDDLRTSLGCYEDKAARTPAIDKLASRGVRFDNAYCQYPICGPSRASFLSGLRPQTSGYYGWAYPPNITLLPAWFKQHGYFTAEYGKVFHCDRLKFDIEIEQIVKRTGRPYQQPKFRTVNPPGCWDISDLCSTEDDPDGYGYLYSRALRAADPKAQSHTLVHGGAFPKEFKGGWFWSEWAETSLSDDRTSDGIVVRRAAKSMELAVRQGRPFLIAAGIRRPHELLAAPQRYFEMHPLNAQPAPPTEPHDHLNRVPAIALPFNKEWAYRIYSSEDRRNMWRAYRANVSFVDAQVAVLMEALDRLDLWDDTIVIFHSDNGMHLGEHGGAHNKHTLFNESTRSPLIILAPDSSTSGSSCSRPVELVDVFPTLTALCRLPQPPNLDGVSLLPLLRDPASPALRQGATSVVRRWVEGRQAQSHGGPPLALQVDAGPKRRQVLGHSVRTEEWRYTEWDGGDLGVELYNETSDPQELNNLADDPDSAGVCARLRSLLRRRGSSLPAQ